MGHHVQAIMGEKSNLDEILRMYGHSKAIELPQGIHLLPLTEDLYDAVAEVDDNALRDPAFMFLSSKIGSLLLSHASGRGLVYFETDYFGGTGTQGAVYVKAGEVLMAPTMEPNSINHALKLWGIGATGNKDEFATLFLDWFRSNEDWIEQPIYGNQIEFSKIVKQQL